jgi:hypothetical protein
MPAEIIEILHKDILPINLPPIYEMRDGNGNAAGFEGLFYRRGLTPREYKSLPGEQLEVPLVNLTRPAHGYESYLPEVKDEIETFVNECVSILPYAQLSIKEALTSADVFFQDRGTFIKHILYSSDLTEELSPVFSYVLKSQCIKLKDKKRTLVILPEPVCAGTIAIKEALASYGPTSEPLDKTRFGMMISSVYWCVNEVP